MTMRDPARAYRESAVRGASPVGLIVILYDEIVRSLRRAERASEENKIEERTQAVNHALQVIGHLQATLNFEAGGEVAQSLSHFYNLARTKIIDANLTKNSRALQELVGEFLQVAAAWQELDRRANQINQAAGGQSVASTMQPLANALNEAIAER
jgi:flagellar secretion chaperone FliS